MYSEIVFSHILQRSKHYTQLSRGARVLNVNEAIEDKGQFLSLGVPCRIESIDCLRKFTDSLSRVEAPSTFNCTPNGGGGGETGWLHRSMAAFMNALFLFIFPLSSCAERFLPLISVILRLASYSYWASVATLFIANISLTSTFVTFCLLQKSTSFTLRRHDAGTLLVFFS